MRVLRAISAMVFCVATGVQASAGPAQQMTGRKDCQFMPPAGWHDGAFSWDGPCRDGMAHGQGVMRLYQKGAPALLFFGELEHGKLGIGVIEGRDGYQAGRFSDGKLMPERERNEIIRAFRSASAAAKATSLRLQRGGNAKSAEFYRKKSQELAQQMD